MVVLSLAVPLSGVNRRLGVDRLPDRLRMTTPMGADHIIDASCVDPIEEIMRLTAGPGVDVASL